MGLLLLFLFAAGILSAIGTFGLIYHLRHPIRKTFAVALARNQPTDPADLDMAAEEKIFHFDDGTESPGWVIQGAKPDGPTIIVTHGWSNSRFSSLLRAHVLKDYASRVVVYDVRAHGDSTATEATLTRKEPGDLLAIMDQVDTGGAFALQGSSRGAGIAIVAAAKYFEQHADESEQTEGRSSKLIAVITEAPYRFAAQPLRGYLWRKRIPPYPIVWFTTWHLAFWDGIRKATYDRAVHVAKIKCPVLVLHGEKDCVCPIQTGKIIADAAQEGTFVVFPGQDHVNLAKADEQRYRESVDAFFKKIG